MGVCSLQTTDVQQLSLMRPINPAETVMDGICYGREDQLLSPAYWAMRCETADMDEIDFVNRHGSLEEEVGFCLLGGFGVTLEVATAFYERLRDCGVFSKGSQPTENDILGMLVTPATVLGRPHKYRFPNQRARRIAGAMRLLEDMKLATDNPVRFRDQLQSLEGIGPKTASWIARNWLDTDDIAILDIHVLRAGWFLGLFHTDCRLPRDYLALEAKFLTFAHRLHVRPSVLDSVMWFDMRTFGSNLARRTIAA